MNFVFSADKLVYAWRNAKSVVSKSDQKSFSLVEEILGVGMVFSVCEKGE